MADGRTMLVKHQKHCYFFSNSEMAFSSGSSKQMQSQPCWPSHLPLAAFSLKWQYMLQTESLTHLKWWSCKSLSTHSHKPSLQSPIKRRLRETENPRLRKQKSHSPVCFPSLNWHHPAHRVCCSSASISSEQKGWPGWVEQVQSSFSSQVPPEWPEMLHHTWQTLGSLHRKDCRLTNILEPAKDTYMLIKTQYMLL